jgi:hypothetical protein
MGNGNQLGLALQRLHNLLVGRDTANLGLDLGHFGAVSLEAVGKRVGKVSAVQYDLLISMCSAHCMNK